MMKRTEEIEVGTGLFPETFESEDQEKLAVRLLRAAKKQGYNKLFVPFDPADLEAKVITEDEIRLAHDDAEVLYILLGNVGFEKQMPYIYSNANFEQKLGIIHGNVMALPFDYTMSEMDLIDAMVSNIEYSCTDAEVGAKIREIQEQRIQDFVTNRRESQLRVIESRIRNTERDMEDNRTQLVRMARATEVDYATLSGLKGAVTVTAAQKEELRDLFKSPALVGVDFPDANVVRFKTRDISITDIGGAVHPIGVFEVLVNLDTSDMTFINNDNKKSSSGDSNIPHPHCSSAGKPCLGNIATILPELCASYDLLGLWQIVHSYLTSYNPADEWGRRLKYWPAYDDSGNVVGTPRIAESDNVCTGCGYEYSTNEDGEIDEDVYTCIVCGALLCEDCAEYSDSEGGDLCASHRVYCDTCDTYHRETTQLYTCAGCGNTFCDQCNSVEGESGALYCCTDCMVSEDDVPHDEEEPEEYDTAEEEVAFDE